MTRAEVKNVKSKARAIKKPSPMEELLIAHENMVRLEGEISSWRTRYTTLLDTIVLGDLPWTKTKMQEKKGGKSDTYKEGQTAIIRTPITRRTLHMDAIRKTFPDLIKTHGMVSLGIADKILGSETVDKFCETEIRYRYDVQSLRTEMEKVKT